jgi:hypothetical protein
MIRGGIKNIHAEYPIPPKQIKVDLLSSITGEVWEIKPWADQDEAILELNERLIAFENAKRDQFLHGMNPIAMPYDWNEIPAIWLEGFSFSSEVYIGTDDSGEYDLYAGQTLPGVIAWWKYKRPKPEKVPYPIYLPYNMKTSERNERPNWAPRSAYPPQPVYAFEQPDTRVGQVIVLVYFGYKLLEFCVNPILVFVTP